jgi:hypothetical protein
MTLAKLGPVTQAAIRPIDVSAAAGVGFPPSVERSS